MTFKECWKTMMEVGKDSLDQWQIDTLNEIKPAFQWTYDHGFSAGFMAGANQQNVPERKEKN